jgi:hypothetical protein
LEIFLLSNGFSGAHDFHSNNSNVFYIIFVGNTRSLSKKEASEKHSNWVGSGLALKF